jgi:hypothetical protein
LLAKSLFQKLKKIKTIIKANNKWKAENAGNATYCGKTKL